MNKPYRLVLSLMLFMISLQAQAQTDQSNKPTSHSILEESDPFKGFFDFYYNSEKDKIYLKVSQTEKEFLYVNSLSQGIGNNDIGLDRGQLGSERVVYFSRSGNKLLLIQPNLRYRSTSDNPLEQRSIKEAFAKSVLFGFPIVETLTDGLLIDLSPFLLEDAHGVAKRLKQLKQGSFKIDQTRSAVNLEDRKSTVRTPVTS